MAPSSSFRAILLDVEGTTTPASFVYETLFPFAKAALPGFIASGEVWDREALLREYRSDADPGKPAWDEHQVDASSLGYLLFLMSKDRKSSSLKAIQGQIWQKGYDSGELRGQVYADVPRACERWKGRGLGIGIFSSGSVQAQRLLFGSVESGDLTRWIDAYFDTSTGPKTHAGSYLKIASALGYPADAVLFVSDVAAELEGARAAGCQARLCVREGAIPSSSEFAWIRSLDEVA